MCGSFAQGWFGRWFLLVLTAGLLGNVAGGEEPDEEVPAAVRLASAIDSGSVAAVRRAIREGADLNEPFQETLPLVRAIWAERFYVARELCQQGAEVNLFDQEGCTPLVWGIEMGNVAIVSMLLQEGADPNLAEKRHGMSPLQVASGSGNVAMVEALLARGANAAHRDAHQGTALEEAAFGGHQKVARLLIEWGLTTRWPLHVAAGLGDMAEVERLLAAGAKFDEPTAGWGNTPLMFAAAGGQLEIAKLLVEQGASLEATNQAGATLLHVAAGHNRLEVVRWLVEEQGCDPGARDGEGATALEWAKNKEVVRYLKALTPTRRAAF